ncbi:hypothetical protein Dimus_033409, partial [Dionaea muscipula]
MAKQRGDVLAGQSLAGYLPGIIGWPDIRDAWPDIRWYWARRSRAGILGKVLEQVKAEQATEAGHGGAPWPDIRARRPDIRRARVGGRITETSSRISGDAGQASSGQGSRARIP